MSNKRIKLFLINTFLILGLIALVLLEFFGLLYMSASPRLTESKDIFSHQRMLDFLPMFFVLVIIAVLIAAISPRK
jgi:hypothetical protein